MPWQGEELPAPGRNSLCQAGEPSAGEAGAAAFQRAWSIEQERLGAIPNALQESPTKHHVIDKQKPPMPSPGPAEVTP